MTNMNHIGSILDDHRNNPQTSLPANQQISQPVDQLISGSANQQTSESVVEETRQPENQPPRKPVDTEDIRRQVYTIKNQLDVLLKILDGDKEAGQKTNISPTQQVTETGEKIIEGVFNGEKMVGPDGQEYSVPPNYASKSKLVEGDLMKLTVTSNGSFIYKQIGPAVRKRLIGKLIFNQDNQTWDADVDGTKFKVLSASISFYKGKPSDEVVLLVPENGKSDWGAVENIISK